MPASKSVSFNAWTLFTTPCCKNWDPSSHRWLLARFPDSWLLLQSHLLLDFPLIFFFFLNACWICSVYMWPCAAQLVKSSHSFFGHFLCTWFHWERSLCLLVSCLIFISEEANFFLCFTKIFNLIFGAKVIAIFALLKFVFDIGIHT